MVNIKTCNKTNKKFFKNGCSYIYRKKILSYLFENYNLEFRQKLGFCTKYKLYIKLRKNNFAYIN